MKRRKELISKRTKLLILRNKDKIKHLEWRLKMETAMSDSLRAEVNRLKREKRSIILQAVENRANTTKGETNETD